MVELARAGRPIQQLAREFEPTANAIRKWVKQAGSMRALHSDGLTTSSARNLIGCGARTGYCAKSARFLSKAAAWFATETGSVPSRRSNS